MNQILSYAASLRQHNQCLSARLQTACLLANSYHYPHPNLLTQPFMRAKEPQPLKQPQQVSANEIKKKAPFGDVISPCGSFTVKRNGYSRTGSIPAVFH